MATASISTKVTVVMSHTEAENLYALLYNGVVVDSLDALGLTKLMQALETLPANMNVYNCPPFERTAKVRPNNYYVGDSK